MTLLQVRGLTKRYGGAVVLDHVDLALAAGARHAVVGPNGAGKTTLLGLIGGAGRPTSGTILFDGRDVTRLPAWRRARLGLARTWQQPALADRLSVAANVSVALRGHRWREDDRRGRVAELLAEAGLAGQAHRLAGQLSHGQRRLLELVVATAARPQLLLLDEPSAGLSPAEVATVRVHLAALPVSTAVLLVDHDRVLVDAVAHDVTELRHGRRVPADGPVRVPARRSPARTWSDRPQPGPAAPTLTVRGLSVGYPGRQVLRDVSLDVDAGEIVAVTGANGVGKTMLLHAIAGLVPADGGQVRLRGRDITGWAAHARARAGVALVPQGRRIWAGLTVADHLRVPPAAPRVGVAVPLEELLAGLHGRMRQQAQTLSGGEQQMLAIARAITSRPQLLLLDEPAEGLAAAVVDQLAAVIAGLADAGVAVLLVDQHDLLPVADRVLTPSAQGGWT